MKNILRSLTFEIDFPQSVKPTAIYVQQRQIYIRLCTYVFAQVNALAMDSTKFNGIISPKFILLYIVQQYSVYTQNKLLLNTNFLTLL